MRALCIHKKYKKLSYIPWEHSKSIQLRFIILLHFNALQLLSAHKFIEFVSFIEFKKKSLHIDSVQFVVLL